MPGVFPTNVPAPAAGLGVLTSGRTTAAAAPLPSLGSTGPTSGRTTAMGSAPKASFGQILAEKRRSLSGSSGLPTMGGAALTSPRNALANTAPNPALQGLTSVEKANVMPISLSRATGTATPVRPASHTAAGPLGPIAPPMSTPMANGGALALQQYPRPADDDGRGVHWVPTVSSNKETVDRFVKEADEMGIRWVTFLNSGTQVGDNDYLVQELVKRGMMPVMRVYTPNGAPIQGDLGAMVRHYVAMGVPYFQLYNEPNLSDENNGATPSVGRYLDRWAPAARQVLNNGGLPGFGALAPGANYDDLQFLREAVQGLKERGEINLLDRSWLSIHNYMFNRPVDYAADSNGFLKFRAYDQILREGLGRSLPMIGTEGGALVGWNQDAGFPAVDRNRQAQLLQDAFRYMGEKREPYNLAYNVWNIANKEGGSYDPSYEKGALFTADGASPAVAAIKSLGVPAASPAVAGVQVRAPNLGEQLLGTAQKLIGSKYVWGGHAPSGFDCTGFTWYVAQQGGLKIPQHDLAGQMNSGPRIQKSELKAGDLVFFQNTYKAGLSHVGIASGDGRFVHAASERQGVMTSRLDDPYWAQRYVGATRPVSSNSQGARGAPATQLR